MKKLIIIATIFLLIVGVISATLATTVGAKQVEPESVAMANNPSKPNDAIKEGKLVGMGAQGLLFGTYTYGLSAYFTNPNDEPITLKSLSVYAENGTENYTGAFVFYDGPTGNRYLKPTISPHETILMRLQYYKWTGANTSAPYNPTNAGNWKDGNDVVNIEPYNMISFEIEWEANNAVDPIIGYMSERIKSEEVFTLYHIPLVNLDQ